MRKEEIIGHGTWYDKIATKILEYPPNNKALILSVDPILLHQGNLSPQNITNIRIFGAIRIIRDLMSHHNT